MYFSAAKTSDKPQRIKLAGGLAGAVLFLGLSQITQAADGLVEVRLIADIDEDRGYCLDIAGGRGANAPIDKGLQAHTCYNYTGSLSEDQSFDPELFDSGQFMITYYDVCMAASATEAGASIVLETCGAADNQSFLLKDNGHLVLRAKPELCVTVSSTEKREGRGGTPAHVMRPLSLQACDDDNKQYQAWSVYSL